eukprot:jgi/Tetstr1/460026/TSEL_005346.t1
MASPSPLPRKFGTDATNRTPEPAASKPSPVVAKPSPAAGGASPALVPSPASSDAFRTPPACLGRLPCGPRPASPLVAPPVGVDIAAASPATARATLQEMNHALVARMQQKKDTQKQANKRLRELERERQTLQQALGQPHSMPLDSFSFHNKENVATPPAAEPLQEELAVKDAQIRELGERVAALDAQLAAAKAQLDEVNATAAALKGFEMEAKQSAARVTQLAEDLRKAKTEGTPRGEGAKKVMKLSFHKIAGLQEQLQAEQKRAQSAESRLSELEGDAQRLWETVMRSSKMEAELRAKVAQVEGQAALAETEKSEAQAEARSLEARVLDQTRQLQRVNEDKEGALAEIAGLREQLQEALDDARAAANRGTPRGEGAKKVLKLALVRIKELNERIDVINAEVKQADERAEQVQLAAASALAELRESNVELANKYHVLERSLQDTESHHRAEVERLLEASQRDAAARDTDADVLSGALAEQQAKLSALERRESSLRRELTALEAENLEIRSLLIEHQELSELAGEMGARYASQISELCRQLGDKDAEVREARLEGTPRGEGAKVLRDRLLARLRQREQQLEVAEAALADAVARAETAEEQSAADRCAATQAEGTAARLALELASELHSAVQEVSESRQAVAEMEAAADVEGDMLRQHIAELERQLADAAAGRAAAEAEMRLMSEESAAMVNDLVEANAESEKLRRKLQRRDDQILRAKAEGTPQGEGAKVVRDMLIVRLKEREEQLDAARAEVSELRAALSASGADLQALNTSLKEAKEEVQEAEARLQASVQQTASMALEMESLREQLSTEQRCTAEVADIAASQISAASVRTGTAEAVAQLRVSLDLMAAETQELEEDCRLLAEQRADAVEAADAWRQRCQNLQKTVEGLEGMVRGMADTSKHFLGAEAEDPEVEDAGWAAEQKAEPRFSGSTPMPPPRKAACENEEEAEPETPADSGHNLLPQFEALEAQLGRLAAEVTAADVDAQRCQQLARTAAADAAEARAEGLKRRQEAERLAGVVAAAHEALAARDTLIAAQGDLASQQGARLEGVSRQLEDQAALAGHHLAQRAQQELKMQGVAEAADGLLSSATRCQHAETERAQITAQLEAASRELAAAKAVRAAAKAPTTSRHSQTTSPLAEDKARTPKSSPAPAPESHAPPTANKPDRRQLTELLVTSALATLMAQLQPTLFGRC